MYDYLIVGAGLYGAVFAQRKKNKERNALSLIKDHILQEIFIQRK